MKLQKFRVQNYRNIVDSGWINADQITTFVGQNESGKSNLFEALYRLNPFEEEEYNLHEDWPMDDWGNRDQEAIVCMATFLLSKKETKSLWEESVPKVEIEGEQKLPDAPQFPDSFEVTVSAYYSADRLVDFNNENLCLDKDKAINYILAKLPRFVYIKDYELFESHIELDQLANKYSQQGWTGLSSSEQGIFIVLNLAQVDLDEFNTLSQTPEGRTRRQFDKRAASAYLTQQFSKLWSQKKVRFDIDIDGTTLNVFVEDEGLGMPVKLENRSTGFRWHVGFAWKFTYASKGDFSGCILLLEEPGVHLHYQGQQDLLRVFEDLSDKNQILYTTHLSSMVDPAYPERVRIVETHDHHAQVLEGIVSNQKLPMAVIEARLGLTGSLGSLMGIRKTLIVEGGDDVLILQKLSSVLSHSGKEGLSEDIYMWPAEGASKTPMFAGFLIGHGWDSGVLLDSDAAGEEAKKKIQELYLNELSAEEQQNFRVFMLNEAAKIGKNEAAIEDVFPNEFYLECVNAAYRINITEDDLPKDGSASVTKQVKEVLKSKHSRSELDKRLVLKEILKRFSSWNDAKDLPKGTADKAETLFKKVNGLFTENKKESAKVTPIKAKKA